MYLPLLLGYILQKPKHGRTSLEHHLEKGVDLPRFLRSAVLHPNQLSLHELDRTHASTEGCASQPADVHRSALRAAQKTFGLTATIRVFYVEGTYILNPNEWDKMR